MYVWAMGLKGVFKKLNLSGLTAGLSGLRKKLPFGKAKARSDSPGEPEFERQHPLLGAGGLDDKTDPGLGTPPPEAAPPLATSKLKQLASRVGAIFTGLSAKLKRNNDATSDVPVVEAAASTESGFAASGNAAQRLLARASNALRDMGTRLRAQVAVVASFVRENFPKNAEDLKKIQPEELLERFRQATGGRAVGTYLRLGAAGFAAYFLADTVSLFTDSLIPDPPAVPAPVVRRQQESRRSMNDYAAILSRNIFSSTNTIPEDTQADGIARKTNLPLVLIGTMVLKDELKSIATIEDKSANMVFPVRIEDVVNDRIQIKKIEHLRVTFVNRGTGQLEFVEIVEDLPGLNIGTGQSAPKQKSESGIQQTSETNFQIESKVIRDGMANLNDVLQQARAIPNFENGMPDGYKILQIVPGSIFDKLGIKNGDVIVGLNGDSVNDPGRALSLLNELPNMNHVEIQVKRGGQKKTMSYDIR